MKQHTSIDGIFPRKDDGKGWAWGLTGAKPEEVWERFSPAYEAQAQTLLIAMGRHWSKVELDWAGSEDGEAALGLSADGELQFCYHLENPDSAESLAKAIKEDRLDGFLKGMMQS